MEGKYSLRVSGRSAPEGGIKQESQRHENHSQKEHDENAEKNILIVHPLPNAHKGLPLSDRTPADLLVAKG
jgi:aspartate carbamoyltransferase catalytic subunit